MTPLYETYLFMVRRENTDMEYTYFPSEEQIFQNNMLNIPGLDREIDIK